MSIKSFSSFNEEAKGDKWIQDAIKNPGALKKSMGKGEGEKISKSEINAELSKLKSKDKDPDKKGVQGLSKKDLTKFKRLNLAKTLKGLKEHQEHSNYMFFANLETIQRLVDEMLHMDKSKLDSILSDGHGWAVDHISTSKDDIEEVFNFLASHDEPTQYDSMNQPIETNESTFDYGWGKGVGIGGDAPSDLRFYLDKKLNKLVYSYKDVKGILKDEDRKNLIDFLKQFE